MNSPYGLPVVDDCQDCPLRKGGFFCDVSAQLKQELGSVSHSMAYPQGSVLAVEGQAARGVAVICSGQVKLSSTSREGKTVIIRIARPGEVIGLSSVVGGTPHQATVEAMSPCLTRFISREDFTRLLKKSPELSMQVARALSAEFHAACQEIRSLALAPSTASKFASLLLSWSGQNRSALKSELKITTGFTHQQMAEMIGTTRETVTRVLSEMKRDRILEVKGATLVVRDLEALQELAV
ncbi:MAG: Crp/Fnr family transcriptional regulator [Acidobacteria bacterium]|nr:Crp/Fnr family transcriptional regulator [Acidobacteriota bacterium]